MRTTVSYFKTDFGPWIRANGFSGNNFKQVQGKIQDSVDNGENPPDLFIPVRLPRRLRLAFRGGPWDRILVDRREVYSHIVIPDRVPIDHDHSLNF